MALASSLPLFLPVVQFFHPSNFQNQKRKFAAEQGELSRIKREKELKDEYAKERSELEAK